MKKSIKKILILISCLVFCISFMTSCGKDAELNDAEAYAKEAVENFILQVGANDAYLTELMAQYAESPIYYDSLANFKAAEEEMGRFVSYEPESVTETDDLLYNVKGTIHFTEADGTAMMTIGLGVSTENRVTGEITYGVTSLEALTVDKVQTFGEKMGNAGLNTLMGMGVVFIVLILISFIIGLFGYINKFEAKLAEKKASQAPQPVKKEAPKAVETGKELSGDTELVAVIAAAIAAYEGTSPDGIVVRSIRKVSSSKNWKRG